MKALKYILFNNHDKLVLILPRAMPILKGHIETARGCAYNLLYIHLFHLS